MISILEKKKVTVKTGRTNTKILMSSYDSENLMSSFFPNEKGIK